MAAAEKSRTLDLLATLSHGTNFSLGCYCRDENRCHRSVPREILLEKGADASIEIDEGSEYGKTALVFAEEGGFEEIVKLLEEGE